MDRFYFFSRPLHRLGGRICLVWALLLGLSTLSAQERINLEYSSPDQLIQGNLVVIPSLDLGSSTQLPQKIRKGQTISIDAIGKAKITFTFQELAWTQPSGFDGKMLVKLSDILSDNDKVLGDQDRAVRIRIGGNRAASVPILGPGKVNVNIAFRISKDGLPEEIIAEYNFPLTIKVANAPAEAPSKRDQEEAWQKAKKLGTIASYQSYLETFPEGPMVGIARNRIKDLEKQAAAVAPKEPRPSPSPTPKEDPSKAAYERVTELRTQAVCESFLDRFPDSEYAFEVELILAEVRDIEIQWEGQDETSFELLVLYAQEPVSFEPTPEDGITFSWDEEATIFQATITDNQRHTVKILDGRGMQTYVELDASIPPIKLSDIALSLDEAGATESMSFRVAGGRPPYVMRLKPIAGDRLPVYLEDIPALESEGLVEISRSTLDSSLADVLPPGDYQVSVLDQRRTENSAQHFGTQIWQTKEIKTTEGGFPLWPIFLGIAVLALIGGIVYNRSQQAKKAAQRAAIEARKAAQQQTRTQQPATPAPATPKPQQRTVPPKEAISPLPPPTAKPRGGIRVTRKAAHTPDKRPFVADTAPPGTYFALDLTEHWPMTAVKTIYLHRDSIQHLDQFMQDENVSMIEETPDSIPEIGGFLLGNFKPLPETGQYLVALEKFVPITAGEQGVYKVEFGEAAWGELDNVMTEHPDLYNIGWFHTHPGHSLFLSQPDIRIHSGFFRENFQVAMEVDTLTPGLDTAFFTRRPDGVINNTKDRMPGTQWFHWTQVNQWLKA